MLEISKRIHLFEFEDLNWFPKIFRVFITDLLTFQIEKFQIYDSVIPKLFELIEKTKNTTIVDLCSGSGGPILEIRKKIEENLKKEIKLYLTDKYPNKKRFIEIKKKNVCPIMNKIDATKISKNLSGIRTIFTAFHHFKPKDAKKIIQNSLISNMPIAIFEATERNLSSLLTLLIAPIACTIFTLFLKPFKFSRIFWTYIIPIIPIIYTWDGLVSNFRTYSKDDYMEMIKELDKENEFDWEFGSLNSKFHITVNYLIGCPKKQSKEL